MLSLSLKKKKSEKKAAANSLETKFNKVLSDLIGKCEKAEMRRFRCGSRESRASQCPKTC
jgi:hypothetical protein